MPGDRRKPPDLRQETSRVYEAQHESTQRHTGCLGPTHARKTQVHEEAVPTNQSQFPSLFHLPKPCNNQRTDLKGRQQFLSPNRVMFVSCFRSSNVVFANAVFYNVPSELCVRNLAKVLTSSALRFSAIPDVLDSARPRQKHQSKAPIHIPCFPSHMSAKCHLGCFIPSIQLRKIHGRQMYAHLCKA